ncbi:hydrolase [Planctomycetaceae bacterium SH139]
MSKLDAALRYLETRRDAMVRRLQTWCDQNSGSDQLIGLAEMADLLCRDYEQLGGGPRRSPTPPFTTVGDDGVSYQQHTGDLIRWDHDLEASRRVLLMIHYDTVYPVDSQPQKTSLIAPGRLVGPGVADAKGGLLVMLEALAAARRFGLDDGIGWTAVANPDEEIGSPATTAWMREQAEHFQFGMLFEPTLPDGSFVAARKGSGNMTIVVRGRSAHAGRNPSAGRNAVVKLCKILAEIDGLNCGTTALQPAGGDATGTDGSAATGTTVNVARVRGGSALNRVPDLAVGRFNARVVDANAQRSLQHQIEEIISRHHADADYQVELSGGFQSPPKVITPAFDALRARIETAAHTLGREINWRDTGGSCDGSKLAAAGLTNVDTFGPGGDCLHSPDEWVDLDSLVPATQLVITLLHQYALSNKAA